MMGQASRTVENQMGSPCAELAIARRWLVEFVGRPDRRVGRAGAVCPFVPPALHAGTLHMEQWTVSTHPGVPELVAVSNRMVEAFASIPEGRGNPLLHALVVVLPGLAEPSLLDEVHTATKSAVVERGLMIGQFHPGCTERAVRNPRFEVSRSPVPMLALRHMAIHDIVFLDRRRDWVAAYERRFAARYRPGSTMDPFYQMRWVHAHARFGSTAARGTLV